MKCPKCKKEEGVSSANMGNHFQVICPCGFAGAVSKASSKKKPEPSARENSPSSTAGTEK